MSEFFRFDARGLKCPLPVLKARRWIREVPPGATIEILATDPGAPEDFQHFCELGGHHFLEAISLPEGGFAIRFAIFKSG